MITIKFLSPILLPQSNNLLPCLRFLATILFWPLPFVSFFQQFPQHFFYITNKVYHEAKQYSDYIDELYFENLIKLLKRLSIVQTIE